MTRQKWKVDSGVNKPTARIGWIHARAIENIEIPIIIHRYGDDDDYDNQNQLFLISRIKLNRISCLPNACNEYNFMMQKMVGGKEKLAIGSNNREKIDLNTHSTRATIIVITNVISTTTGISRAMGMHVHCDVNVIRIESHFISS